MTEFLEVEGGRIAYEVTGDGPLVVLLPGMGIRRDFYSSLSRLLVAAGYRVAAADLRRARRSSTGWSSYIRTDTAADTLALIRQLGGPQSSSGIPSPAVPPPSRRPRRLRWSPPSWKSARSPGYPSSAPAPC